MTASENFSSFSYLPSITGLGRFEPFAMYRTRCCRYDENYFKLTDICPLSSENRQLRENMDRQIKSTWFGVGGVRRRLPLTFARRIL